MSWLKQLFCWHKWERLDVDRMNVSRVYESRDGRRQVYQSDDFNTRYYIYTLSKMPMPKL